MKRQPGVTSERGLIAWFASNHVAANLLMLMIVAFGVVSGFTIRKQTTPDFELNTIQVRVPYLGAAPQEVEEGVVVKIEEAIQDIDGITKIDSVAREGEGSVVAEVATGEDINEILSEIKTRVDAISTFPNLTEKPVIYKQEVPIHVVFLSIYGRMDAFARKALAQQVQDELMVLPEVNQVEFLGDRDYEISIEVSEQTLRQYGLTMTEVSQAVRDSSVDLPGGTIKTEGGDILLRTEGPALHRPGVLTTRAAHVCRRYAPDMLGDIATIEGRFRGRPTDTAVSTARRRRSCGCSPAASKTS